MYECNTKAISHNHCCRAKAGTITYSDCLSVALLIQHSKRMRHLYPAWLYRIFTHYFINSTILKGMLLNIQCVMIFCAALCAVLFILKIIKRDIIINVHVDLLSKVK
jgi:hypothetical protein